MNLPRGPVLFSYLRPLYRAPGNSSHLSQQLEGPGEDITGNFWMVAARSMAAWTSLRSAGLRPRRMRPGFWEMGSHPCEGSGVHFGTPVIILECVFLPPLFLRRHENKARMNFRKEKPAQKCKRTKSGLLSECPSAWCLLFPEILLRAPHSPHTLSGFNVREFLQRARMAAPSGSF